MTIKKTISILMTLVLLLSVVVPGMSVMGTGSEAHSHSYGQWAFDAENGTQSRTCGECGDAQILHGTDTKVSQVESPLVGQSYHLAANVGGTVYFFRHGTISDTKPYSLVTTDNVNHNWAFQVTLEAPVEGNTGFQMTYQNPTSGATTRIYCYDALTTAGNSGIMDTGANTANYLNRHTFFADTVGGVKVLRKIGNNHILAVKFDSAKGEYRMLGVPEGELGNNGVYPAMLVTVHNHDYGISYEFDSTGHWQKCDCGSTSKLQEHNYVLDETLGYEVCVCGADMRPHECESKDSKWYAQGEKHYQLCGKCGEKINEADHTLGPWQFDAENGTQTKTCSLCGYEQTLYGTDSKVTPVANPEVGQSYYLAANAAGTVYYFALEGSVTATTPYSLSVTTNTDNPNMRPVSLEAPVSGDTGFQITVVRQSDGKLLRIYCYDAGGSDGIMDTGTNATNELAKHTFYVDEVGGVKVLRKIGNNNILAVKYFPAREEFRMLGVPESELGSNGVYPAMLVDIHKHSYSDTTYQFDEQGHWFACECGGKGNYADHVVAKWEYSAVPTQTTPGRKTGVCSICGATAVTEIPPIVAEGYYYLTGSVDGTTYYFRDKTGTESVEHTAPFSLLTTDQKKDAVKVNVIWDDKANTYILSYTTTRQLNIYMGDVNGSTVAKDGKIDLSSSATTTEDLIVFRWDPENQMFYQMENGVKYVIAFRLMTLTDGETQAVRMLAVPAEELGGDTVAMQLQLVHEHSYGDSWSVDAVSHYKECDCGVRKQEGAHQIDQWEVEKEPTTSAPGKKTAMCAICGQKVVNAIPMLTDELQAPADGETFYLIGTLNGYRYYFRHAPAGTSVTDTTPYGLTTAIAGKANALTVKVTDGKYNLIYGSSNYHVYMNANGVGVTSNASNKDLVDFLWDEENKLLYQEENGVKCVLVFQTLKNNKTGGKEVRVTYMPMERALIDPNVAIARFGKNPPPEETKPKKEPVALTMPEDATVLKDAPQQDPPVEEVYTDNAISPFHLMAVESGAGWVAMIIVLILFVIALIALIVLKNTKFGAGLFRKWNLWTAATFGVAAVVLVAGMLLSNAFAPKAPSLAEFTIVANGENMDTANELAVTIYEKYGVSLPVVQSKDYEGNMGIYLDTQGINSYGGYKYSIYSEDGEYGPGVYINGSGPSLDTAISKWLKSVKDPYAFPFGLQEPISGYEWNTDDINMTGLGYSLKEMNIRQLYEGVEIRELKYESFGYGKVTGYAVIVESDADVELKVAAGHWDENTTSDNPGEKHTVGQYGKMLTEDGYEVLAITNAGFYDLNTTMTYIPWGMQIVDGYVKKEPSEENPNNTDNWFGQTADGKYVISDTAGYYETYETTIAQGVGGGRVLMRDGKPCFSTTGADYRTVVGITKGGDLIILTMPSANYAFVAQIFMDMDVDIDCVLNLDGGGSTTLHSLDENGVLKQFVCETPIEREVADAIAIVKKK